MMHRIVLLLVLVSGICFAQDSFVDLLRSDIKGKKVEIIKKEMQFSEEEAEKFWPVYKQYGKELSEINIRELKLIKRYIQFYQKMSDATAEVLYEESLKIKKERLSLEEKYFRKVSKALSSKIAAKFIQIENIISQLVRLQVYSELPVLKK